MQPNQSLDVRRRGIQSGEISKTHWQTFSGQLQGILHVEARPYTLTQEKHWVIDHSEESTQCHRLMTSWHLRSWTSVLWGCPHRVRELHQQNVTDGCHQMHQTAEHCSLMHRQLRSVHWESWCLSWRLQQDIVLKQFLGPKVDGFIKPHQRTAVPALFITMLGLFLGISLLWTVLVKLLWQHLSLTSQKGGVNRKSLINMCSTERLISTFIRQ